MLLTLLPFHQAKANDFDQWVLAFRSEAIQRGVSPETFDREMAGLEPHARVVELDQKQPERTKTGFDTYVTRVLSQLRIDNGRKAYSENRSILNKVSKEYGVPAEVLVSLWGIETSYGKNTGGYDLVTALATLAWEGRRAEFFKKELIEALLILQGDHIERENFKGSWAGAMGQCQFMPSSWHRFAVDFNGDGHKDIWQTKSDVFASSANYLSMSGWNPNLKWGWQIISNDEFAGVHADQTLPYQEWLALGVKFKGHLPSMPASTPLRLVAPEGGNGRFYLVSENFDVIKKWNKSNYFALTVGLLSDFIAKSKAVEDLSDSHFN